ncbi:MAG: M14 family metallopeptidase [Myxococcota bacterium]
MTRAWHQLAWEARHPSAPSPSFGGHRSPMIRCDVHEVGRSVEGRPLEAFTLSPERAPRDRPLPTVLLTGLMHGIEFIGSVALKRVVEALLRRRRDVLQRARFVVLPFVNPDGFHNSSARVRAGRTGWQRVNANGVDLNRNFPWLGERMPRHPFSGTRIPKLPHYVGRHPFSEPETRAIRNVVDEFRPCLSLGFHSPGNMLLYPWGHTDRPNPRRDMYRRLGHAFNRATRRRYEVKQAVGLYPTVGDMDDWLDGERNCLALTVEVGAIHPSILAPRRLLDPFCWMNTPRAEAEITNLVPGVLALLDAAIGDDAAEETPTFQHRPAPLPFAAK